MCKDDVRRVMLGEDGRCRRDRRDAGRPDGVVLDAQPGDLPTLLMAHVAGSGEYVGRSDAVGDEDVVGKEFHVVGVHVGEIVDETEELGGIERGDEVSCVVHGAFNFEESRGRRLS